LVGVVGVSGVVIVIVNRENQEAALLMALSRGLGEELCECLEADARRDVAESHSPFGNGF
jgi:hypothetical protein